MRYAELLPFAGHPATTRQDSTFVSKQENRDG